MVFNTTSVQTFQPVVTSANLTLMRCDRRLTAEIKPHPIWTGSSLIIFTQFEKVWIYPDRMIVNLGIKKWATQHFCSGWLRAATSWFNGDIHIEISKHGASSSYTLPAIVAYINRMDT